MSPTNYAFGGGRVNTLSSPGAYVPRLSGATQDRVSGITRETPNSRPSFSPMQLSQDVASQVQSKSNDINDFGQGITAMKQAAAQKRNTDPGFSVKTSGQNTDPGFSARGNMGYDPGYKAYTGPATGQRKQLIDSALSLQGEQYAWGGGGPGVRQSHGVPGGPGSNVVGVDCSGLTSYAYSQIGIKIPHLAKAQGTIGYRTSVQNLQPGDLVVWNNGTHTSMYMGNGQIVESVPGKGPRVRALTGREAVTGVHLRLPGE